MQSDWIFARDARLDSVDDVRRVVEERFVPPMSDAIIGLIEHARENRCRIAQAYLVDADDLVRAARTVPGLLALRARLALGRRRPKPRKAKPLTARTDRGLLVSCESTGPRGSRHGT